MKNELDRIIECSGTEYLVISRSGDHAGDLYVELDDEDRLRITEDLTNPLTDAQVRCILRFGDAQRALGERRGRRTAQAAVAKVLDMPTRYEMRRIEERIEELER
jgi:hypothetical protein